MVKKNPLARVGRELQAEMRRRRNVPRVATPKADRPRSIVQAVSPLTDPIARLGHPPRARKRKRKGSGK